jgi:hypothetical protein
VRQKTEIFLRYFSHFWSKYCPSYIIKLELKMSGGCNEYRFVATASVGKADIS